MQDHAAIVTDVDMDRLTRLVRAFKHSLFRDQQQIELLDQKLNSAEIRTPGRVPRDVIRMNSCVRVLDCDTQRRELYTLVFPEARDQNEVSAAIVKLRSEPQVRFAEPAVAGSGAGK